jgi:pSer/pThr/pTyr-binding forkhead associated (FHA) protein
MNNYLLVLVGKHKGMKIKLPPTQFLIGRDPRCHLRPASTDVSRHHCAIACRGPVVQLCDLKSENGTFLNEKPISGTVRVQDGDVLKVGSLVFKFGIDTSEEEMQAGASNSSGGAPSEQEVSWLVRDPSEDENKALDPALDTSILPSVVEGGVTASKDGEEAENISAVAGEFFREYMKKGNKRRRRREPGA